MVTGDDIPTISINWVCPSLVAALFLDTGYTDIWRSSQQKTRRWCQQKTRRLSAQNPNKIKKTEKLSGMIGQKRFQVCFLQPLIQFTKSKISLGSGWTVICSAASTNQFHAWKSAWLRGCWHGVYWRSHQPLTTQGSLTCGCYVCVCVRR